MTYSQPRPQSLVFRARYGRKTPVALEDDAGRPERPERATPRETMGWFLLRITRRWFTVYT